MNVIIANKFRDELSNLNIDVIKRLDGEFDINTIVDTFANFYFNRMIIDITAIKDSFNIAVIQKLSASLDATKIILLLTDDPRINNGYLSKVISLGIYNFTRDLSGVTYLMENPNSYRDVAQYHDLAMNDEKSIKESRNNNNMGMGMGMNMNSGMGGFAPNMQVQNNNQFSQSQPSFQPFMGPSYNGSTDPNYNNNNNNMNQSMGNSMNQNTNQGMNPNMNMGMTTNYQMGYGNNMNSSTKIIGFKDLTEDAGATTLIYMLKKNLANRKVLAVELNDNDFSYFGDNELMSVGANQLGTVRSKFNQFDIVLLDLNNSNLDTDGTCSDVIYLLEPSTIKLNKLMRKDRQALTKIKDKKIVLNKSLLTAMDLKDFEREAGVKMFYNIPPLDERKDSQMVLDSFLEKLGVFSNGHSGGGGLFGIFKK